jgi:tetratricopeptide (TPR) repeat protein
LEREHENLWAAFRWSLDMENVEMALRLGGALWRFWRKRGYPLEGLKWLEMAFDLDAVVAERKIETNSLALARAKAYLGAGILKQSLGDYVSAKVYHEKSLRLYREMKDDEGLAYTLFSVGTDSYNLGDIKAAKSYWQESLALYQKIGDRRGEILLYQAFGELAKAEGDLTGAETILSGALTLHRGIDDQYLYAFASLLLGEMRRLQGDTINAKRYLEESLRGFRLLGDKETIAAALHRLGELAWSQGDLTRGENTSKKACCIPEKQVVSWKQRLV